MQETKPPRLRSVKLLLVFQIVTLPHFSTATADQLRAVKRRHVNWPCSQEAVAAFGSSKYFTDRYISSNKPGVRIKLPNFEVLFEDICKVSPLAKQAFKHENPAGISAIDNDADVYKWRVTDSFNPNKLVKEIDKIDNFQNKGVPIIRFRSTLHGPEKKRGECFAELITTAELRHQWDATNDIVDEIYSGDLEELKKCQDPKYGTPSMFGIGYVKTKQSVVSPREQLTLCGLQNFASGAKLIWGVELEESQNYLFPENQPKRVPRSTSHLFATTIIPTIDDTFDVEYVLQLEIGGFPGWLTGPVVIETVKKMFRFADDYFRGGLADGDLAKKLASIPDDANGIGGPDSYDRSNGVLDKKQTLLMPP
eukprot:CCRYP_009851-RA/>CCRYP_009851-RA protein AED:0.04 eAED:0.04 QI:204/1/1/1/1/1/3/262/365